MAKKVMRKPRNKIKRGSHGGRRAGSGRKPVMPQKERWRLGGICEALWQRRIERSAFAKYKDQPKFGDFRRIQKEISYTPVKFRQRPSSSLRERIGDVRNHLRTHGRYHTIPLIRQYNKRVVFVKRLARWISICSGRKIEPPSLNECWREFRKLQTRIKRDRSSET